MANVYINCQFGTSVTVNAPVYLQPAVIGVTYSANSINQCTIPSITGNVEISNTISGYIAYTTAASISNVGSSPASGYLTINSNAVPQSTYYIATLALASPNITESSTSNMFQVISPANILITSLTVSPSSPSQGSQITITTNILNSGSLVSSNAFLNLKITGPNGFSYVSNTAVANLAPQQSTIISTTLTSVTQTTQKYTVVENVSYVSTYTYNSVTYQTPLLYSNAASTTYTVPSTVTQCGSCGVVYIPPVPVSITIPSSLLQFTQIPIFSEAILGSTTIGIMGLENMYNDNITVSLSVPKYAFGTLELSSSTVYLTPKTTQLVDTVFEQNRNTTPGTYVVPINVTTRSISNGKLNTQSSVVFAAYNVKTQPNYPYYIENVNLFNNTQTAKIEFSVYNPTPKPLYNVNLSFEVPRLSMTELTSIKASGPVYHISNTSGETIVTWVIPKLIQNSSALLETSISNITSPSSFYNLQASLASASTINATSFSISSINAPIFLENQSGAISVTALYTGTNETNVTMTLVPPPGLGITVQNKTQRFHVFPNTLVTATYNVSGIGTLGTSTFQLRVFGPFSEQTYSIPVLVVPPPEQSPISLPNLPKTPPELVFLLEVIAAIIIIIVMIIEAIKHLRNRPKYVKSRAEELKRVRQRVNRTIED
ncbi:MAG: hypothetical protein M1504_00560 [Candidatus Marsarchaeota archaeon]|nr:hypothetical protein [Candidatus Marsarchaeota archaeon]